MSKSSIFAVVIALLVGIAGGYVVGRQGASEAGAASDGLASGRAGSGPSGVGMAGGSAADGGGKASAEAEAGGAGGLPVEPGSLAERAFKLMEAGDVEAAFKAIFAEPGQMERMDALMQLVKRLDAPGIEMALAGARGLPGRMDVFMSMNLLMGRYAEIDPEKALAFAEGSSGFERMMGTSSILRTWAAKDPKAAGDYFVKTVLDSGVDDWQMRRTAASVASEWVRRDPDAALAWAKGLPEDVSGDALQSIIEHFTSEDPGKAAALAMTFEGENQTRALQSIAEQWARTEPAAAAAWADGLDNEARIEVLEQAMRGWAGTDPAGARAYVDAISDPAERDGLLPDVAGRWARRDAAAAAEAATWVAAQANGEGKQQATAAVIDAWIDSDPQAASTWLGQQPDGPAKDRGIVEMLGERELREDPATAAAWAASITDPKIRSEQIFGTARNWLAEDRAAATEYIGANAELSEEQKATLINLSDEDLQRGGNQRFRGRPF